MYLAHILGVFRGYALDVRFESRDEVGVEFGDEGVVGLLLGGLVEGVPGEGVDVPGVDKVDIWEAEGEGSL